MSAPLQTSSTKLDIASPSKSMLTSPAAGVGAGAVTTPFATLFAAVQISEVTPEKTAVAVIKSAGEDKTSPDVVAIESDIQEGVVAEGAVGEGIVTVSAVGEGIVAEGVVEEVLSGEVFVGFEQTNSVLAPRQNIKATGVAVEDEDLPVEPWPDFAAIPAWSILPEEVVLAAPVSVSFDDTPISPDEKLLLIEPINSELAVDFVEQFAPKFVAAEGDPVIAVADALPSEEPLLQTVVTSIEPVNTAGPIKLAVAAAVSDVVATVSTTIFPVVDDVVTPVENIVAQVQQVEVVKIQPIAGVRQNIDEAQTPAVTAPNVVNVQMPIKTNTIEGPYGLVPMELDPDLVPQNPVGGTANQNVVLTSPVTQVISAEQVPAVAAPVIARATIETTVETQIASTPPALPESDILDDAVLPSPVSQTVDADVLVEEPALLNGQLIGNKDAGNGSKIVQNTADLTDIVEDLTLEPEAATDAPVAKLAPDAVRTAASVHPVAAMTAVAPKRVSEKEADSLNVDGQIDETVSFDGTLDVAATRPAIQSPQNSVVAGAASARTAPAAREAVIQRAIAQSNSEQLMAEEDLAAELNLSLSQPNTSTSAPSNATTQAMPTAMATSAGTAAILDVRRQGWTKTLVNRAASMAQAGGSMTLSILPQNLGQITLKLSEGRKGLELRMTADVASTTAMLRDVQGQIESAFEQAGLKLGSYSAQTGGQGQQGGSNQSSSQEDGEIDLLEQTTSPETDRIDPEDPDRLNILL